MTNKGNKKYKIYLSPPHLTGSELTYIKETLEHNWITTEGEQIDRFEETLAGYLGGRKVVLLNSGTAALHLACRLLDVGPGDFVLCQNFTFIATVNPVKYQNAIPVLVDSETDTWNMDPMALEDAIKYCIRKGHKPKALIYAHIYGMPAKIEEILYLANKYEIPVIEDAAEGLGSKYKEKNVGQFGDISILSFNGNKIITSSGGGALVTNSDRLSAKAKYLASQAKNNQVGYQHDDVGYNYRMSNVLAAIGRAQFNDLENRIATKRKILDHYNKRLNQHDLITFQQEPNNCISNRWLTCLLIKDEKVLKNILQKFDTNGIEARPLWKPISKQAPYRKCLCFGENNAEVFNSHGVSLPSGLHLNNRDLNEINNIILASLRKYLT